MSLAANEYPSHLLVLHTIPSTHEKSLVRSTLHGHFIIICYGLSCVPQKDMLQS